MSLLWRGNSQLSHPNTHYDVTWCSDCINDENQVNHQALSKIVEGIIEIMDTIVKEMDASVRETVERIHYLPHDMVICHDKNTAKVRVIHDASVRYRRPSLNDYLYTGSKFHQRIVDLLLRFRTYRIALMADIEKAFLMIQIAVEDRDVLRFLWVGDIMKEQPKPVRLWFTQVVFVVSPSLFLLNATIQHHLK